MLLQFVQPTGAINLQKTTLLDSFLFTYQDGAPTVRNSGDSEFQTFRVVSKQRKALQLQECRQF